MPIVIIQLLAHHHRLHCQAHRDRCFEFAAIWRRSINVTTNEQILSDPCPIGERFPYPTPYKRVKNSEICATMQKSFSKRHVINIFFNCYSDKLKNLRMANISLFSVLASL